MQKLRAMTIVGARPQFVKAAVVSRSMRAIDGLVEISVHTGQHYDQNMSGVFFEQLAIPAPVHQIAVGSLPHGAQTGRMLAEIEKLISSEKPDLMVVYGDTNSTLAGALAAAKMQLPVVHIEAGLRSFNRTMPEEINRLLTDHVSELLFAPTRNALNNLTREGISSNRIHVVGDVMRDVVDNFAKAAEGHSRILSDLGLTSGLYVLATVHRAENTDDPTRLRAILEALAQTAKEYPVVLPLHPRTRRRATDAGLLGLAERLTLLEPVGYLDSIVLQRNAAAVATDSGGMQKEAYFCRVPCITLRNETEWTELIELGVNRLCPPSDAMLISQNIREAIDAGFSAEVPTDVYGAGDAAAKITDVLVQTYLK